MNYSSGVRLWTRLGQATEGDYRTDDYRENLREVLDSVREHLTWLLNTRQGDAPACASYGLPDLAGVVAGLPKLENKFCKALEASIREHEPRISWVRVRLNDSAPSDSIRIDFTVELMLKSQQDSEKRRLTGAVDIDTVFKLS